MEEPVEPTGAAVDLDAEDARLLEALRGLDRAAVEARARALVGDGLPVPAAALCACRDVARLARMPVRRPTPGERKAAWAQRAMEARPVHPGWEVYLRRVGAAGWWPMRSWGWERAAMRDGQPTMPVLCGPDAPYDAADMLVAPVAARVTGL